MTNTRSKNDTATTDRRDMADRTMKENRAKNDEITADRRDKADKLMDENRSRNDEMTTDRRNMHDRNPNVGLGIFLLVLLIGLTVGVFFVFT